MMKMFGALLILIGCGGVGFSLVASWRRQEQSLEQLIRALEYMGCELQYRMTPLPALCHGASQICTGCVRSVMRRLGLELEQQIIPDAAACMHATVTTHTDLPKRLHPCLIQLGDSLGCFDLDGQLQGLASVRKRAEYELSQMRQNHEVRLRSYQTLGLCAGAALVVLFL